MATSGAPAGLLALQNAAEGGLSSWSSSVSVHNELLRRGRVDLVKVSQLLLLLTLL